MTPATEATTPTLSDFPRLLLSGRRCAGLGKTRSDSGLSMCSSTRPEVIRHSSALPTVWPSLLIVAGHRETWPIKSKPFYAAYVAYLRRQFNRLISEEPMLAVAVRAAMRKPAINAAIADFEVRAVGAARVRDVCVRVAGHDGEIYIDLCNE